MGAESASIHHVSIPGLTHSQSMENIDLISGRPMQDADVIVFRCRNI